MTRLIGTSYGGWRSFTHSSTRFGRRGRGQLAGRCVGEGYTKNSLLNYWKFVATKRLAYDDLALNFVALAVEREVARAGVKATEQRLLRVRRLAEGGSDRALMVDREIDTQSNLSSEVLSDLFLKLGLVEGPIAARANFIDHSLVRVRNSVAHGEYLDLSVAVYDETHAGVLDLMRWVRTAVSNAAATSSYRRAPITRV